MRITMFVLFSVLFLSSIAYGGDSYEESSYDSDSYDSDAEDRRFLGNLSTNELDLNSLSNPYRLESNELTIDSPLNEFNVRGGASPFELDGWANELSLGGGIEVFE